MGKHSEVLRKILADLKDEEVPLAEGQTLDPSKKVIKDAIRDEANKFDRMVAPHEKRLHKLDEELNKLEDSSGPSTPRTPTRSASPLMFLVTKSVLKKPSDEEDDMVGADLVDQLVSEQNQQVSEHLKKQIAGINDTINQISATSQQVFFLKYPALKQRYAAIFFDDTLFDDREVNDRNTSIDSYLKKNTDTKYQTLRDLRTEMKVLENTIREELKKSPQEYAPSIFSDMEKYDQLATKLNDAWLKFKQEAVQKKSGGFSLS